ncbi:PREDICTED: transcription factor SFL2 [Trachymyrmex septentrionalis]|uniref:transcription factor SFL2 n=1 Tax=Trachymyrmex septentrionalis TaxID=34720 RepID=UPI00084ED87F|nr:PREDICTED: transcription factor SFL2 [Trachymyrmex septentrionalis]
MDARRVLPFLLLIIYIINGAFANQNAWSRQYNVRRVRRINEYLIPPPLSKSYPGRIPRLANYQPTPQPGYFQQLMNFLNPFSSDSSPQPQPQPPPPPPSLLPPQPEVAKFGQSYNGPPPVDYEKPPLPPTSLNHLPNVYSGYPAPVQIKNCSSCNRIPWVPIQDTQQGHDGHVGSASYASPPLESPGDRYLPTNHEIPHDAYHAASQEVRAPDFSFAPPLPNIGQNGPFNLLPNPHLFPGAMPPLFKAVNFKQPVQVIPHENSGHLNSPTLSISNSASTIAEPTFNGGHNEQYVYPGPLTHSSGGIVSQELGYTNPSISNGEFENVQNVQNQNNVAHNDLSSSGTQVSHGHTSGVSNNEELYDVTGLSGSDVSQTNQNFPSSYGISSPDRFPSNYEHPYNDLSSSANVAEGSSAPLHIDESSGNVEDSINFEESPLLDFTQKDESRTHSSSIPTNSNAFADFQSTKTIGTTVALGDEIFGTRQGITSTEPYPSTDYIEIIDTVAKESKINNSITQGTNGKFRNLLNDDVAEETLSDNIGVNLDETSGQQGATRNRQIQLIIPYTSQYTPLPFHPPHERNTDTSESNHDNYVGEESRNRIEVISPPNSSHIFQSLDSVPKVFDNAKKSVDAKTNNSIDVHKLQKNIDNWTIQEYSKAVRTISPNSSQTVSTVSPKSSNPYLFPSKKIPTEYFMTTKPVNYVADSHNDNSNILTLSGFSFSDEDNKGSGSNPVEELRVIQTEKSTGSSIDASTASEDLWQGFPVGISSVNRERVYIVTPQPTVTTSRLNLEYRQEKALKEAERNRKELKKTLQTDIKITQKTDTFESIEKAYQVLPQAVNNLAVASTGPDSVPLWGIMEHEEFASPVYSEYDNNDTEPPTPYSRLSKESRARR